MKPEGLKANWQWKQQNGLIEICTIESKYFVEKDQLPQLEKFVHFYYDPDINLEGIETITCLLQRIESMQNEITKLKNMLRFCDTYRED